MNHLENSFYHKTTLSLSITTIPDKRKSDKIDFIMAEMSGKPSESLL